MLPLWNCISGFFFCVHNKSNQLKIQQTDLSNVNGFKSFWSTWEWKYLVSNVCCRRRCSPNYLSHHLHWRSFDSSLKWSSLVNMFQMLPNCCCNTAINFGSVCFAFNWDKYAQSESLTFSFVSFYQWQCMNSAFPLIWNILNKT